MSGPLSRFHVLISAQRQRRQDPGLERGAEPGSPRSAGRAMMSPGTSVHRHSAQWEEGSNQTVQMGERCPHRRRAGPRSSAQLSLPSPLYVRGMGLPRVQSQGRPSQVSGKDAQKGWSGRRRVWETRISGCLPFRSPGGRLELEMALCSRQG